MRSLILTVVLALCLHCAFGVQIFQETFDSGLGTWSSYARSPSYITVVTSPRLGTSGSSISMKFDGRVWKTISTVGYTGITFTANLAANVLESGTDACVLEYSLDKGATYTEVLRLLDGQDNSVFNAVTNFAVGPGGDHNPNFTFRYRTIGDASGDACFAETLTVSGTAGTPPGPVAIPSASSFQDLSGNGAVTRTAITYAQLMPGGSISSPVDLSHFALPANAAQATNHFHAPLESLNEGNVGSALSIKDDFSYMTSPERIHLPKMFHQFIQHGSHLIPATRGYGGPSGHPHWEYIFSPGRIWNENGDNGYTRAAVPFAITQRNANCVHNGVMMFLYKSDANRVLIDVSNVYYQISAETCAYFKVNLWGMIDVQATSVGHPNAANIRTDYAAEVGARLPRYPIAQISTDYPGTVASKFGAGITPADLTAFGYVVDGKHYVGGYVTRHGTYPYPEVMVFPSYSTSKSWFTTMAVLRFSQKYPGVDIYNSIISNLVPTCPAAKWGNVKITHTVDMATGNYNLAGFESDEGSTAMENGYFLQETQSKRLTYACSLPKKKTPGTFWNYHTSDNHIAATAMQAAILAQEPATGSIEKFLENEIFKPIKLSPVTFQPKETYGAGAIAWGTYGEYAYGDDFAKIGAFMNQDEGKIGGVQKLDYTRLKQALQRDPANAGLPVSVPGSSLAHKYKHNFWAKSMYGGLYSGGNCVNGDFTPYMSGYGGITVALLKNKSVYYAVSDNFEYEWVEAALEALAHVRNPCGAPAAYSP